MKRLFLLLCLSLLGTNTQANEQKGNAGNPNCYYFIDGNTDRKEDKMAENQLMKLGYHKAKKLADVKVIFELFTEWSPNYGPTPREINLFGKTSAEVNLIDKEKNKVIDESTKKGGYGIFFGIGIKKKARNLLRKAIKELLPCEDYLVKREMK